MATIITYNGTQIASTDETAPVAVTYGGSTIASIAEGTTKTLNCSGKYMNTNVVVGSKTLNCANKIMSGNVVVQVEETIDYLALILSGEIVNYENDLVTTIGQCAFYGCSNLTSASFPNVTSIDTGSFGFCDSLTELILGGQTMCTLVANPMWPSFPDSVYIYVPNNLVDTYKSDSKWSEYAERIRGI